MRERSLDAPWALARGDPARPDLASRVNLTGDMSYAEPESEIERQLRPRAEAMAWMASMSIAAGELRAAEGYLLELLAWCAFADRAVIDVVGEAS